MTTRAIGEARFLISRSVAFLPLESLLQGCRGYPCPGGTVQPGGSRQVGSGRDPFARRSPQKTNRGFGYFRSRAFRSLGREAAGARLGRKAATSDTTDLAPGAVEGGRAGWPEYGAAPLRLLRVAVGTKGERICQCRIRTRGERSKRVERFFNWPVIVAALLVIPVIVIEQTAVSDTVKSIATVCNWSIWLVFAAELVAMLLGRPEQVALARPQPARRFDCRPHPADPAAGTSVAPCPAAAEAAPADEAGPGLAPGVLFPGPALCGVARVAHDHCRRRDIRGCGAGEPRLVLSLRPLGAAQPLGEALHHPDGDCRGLVDQ